MSSLLTSTATKLAAVALAISMAVGDAATPAVTKPDAGTAAYEASEDVSTSQTVKTEVPEDMEDAIYANEEGIVSLSCYNALTGRPMGTEIELKVYDMNGKQVKFIPCILTESPIFGGINTVERIGVHYSVEDSSHPVSSHKFIENGQLFIRLKEDGYYRFRFTSEDFYDKEVLVYNPGIEGWEQIKEHFQSRVEEGMLDVASREELVEWKEYLEGQDWKQIAEDEGCEDIDAFLAEVETRRNAIDAMLSMDWEKFWQAVDTPNAYQESLSRKITEWLNKVTELEKDGKDDFTHAYLETSRKLAIEAILWCPMIPIQGGCMTVVLRDTSVVSTLLKGTKAANIAKRAEEVAALAKKCKTAAEASKVAEEYKSLASAVKPYCTEAEVSFNANALIMKRVAKVMEEGYVSVKFSVTFDANKVMETDFPNYFIYSYTEQAETAATFDVKIFVPDATAIKDFVAGTMRAKTVDRTVHRIETAAIRTKLMTQDCEVTLNEIYNIAGQNPDTFIEIIPSSLKNNIGGSANVQTYLNAHGNTFLDLEIGSNYWKQLKDDNIKILGRLKDDLGSLKGDYSKLQAYVDFAQSQNRFVFERLEKYGLTRSGYTINCSIKYGNLTAKEMEACRIEDFRVKIADSFENCFENLLDVISRGDKEELLKIQESAASGNGFFRLAVSLVSRQQSTTAEVDAWMIKLHQCGYDLDKSLTTLINKLNTANRNYSEIKQCADSFISYVGFYRKTLIGKISGDKVLLTAAEMQKLLNSCRTVAIYGDGNLTDFLAYISSRYETADKTFNEAIAALKNENAVNTLLNSVKDAKTKFILREEWYTVVNIEREATISKQTLEKVSTYMNSYNSWLLTLSDTRKYTGVERALDLTEAIYRVEDGLSFNYSISRFVNSTPNLNHYTFNTYLLDRSALDGFVQGSMSWIDKAKYLNSSTSDFMKRVGDLTEAIEYVAESQNVSQLTQPGLWPIVDFIRNSATGFTPDTKAMVTDAYVLVTQSRCIAEWLREAQIECCIKALEEELVLAAKESERAIAAIKLTKAVSVGDTAVRTGYANTDLLASMSAAGTATLVAGYFMRSLECKFVEMDAGTISINALVASAIALRQKYQEITVKPVYENTHVVLMTPYTTISGHVADKETGAAISGADVKIRILPYTLYPDSNVAGMDSDYPIIDCGQTDSEGNFTITVPQSYIFAVENDRKIYLTIEKDGYITYDTYENGIQPIPIPREDKDGKPCPDFDLGIISLEKNDRRTTQILVTDTSGKPIEGAYVMLSHLELNKAFSGTTDTEGKTITLYLNEGKYALTAGAKGYEVKETEFSVKSAGNECMTVTVKLEKEISRTLVITVVDDETGKKLSDSEVTVSDEKGNNQSFTTDKKGTVTFNAEKNKAYKISASHEHYASASVSVAALGSQTTKRVTIRLKPSQKYFGHVTDSQGNAINDSYVGYFEIIMNSDVSTDYRLAGYVPVQENGTYELEVPANGQYALNVGTGLCENRNRVEYFENTLFDFVHVEPAKDENREVNFEAYIPLTDTVIRGTIYGFGENRVEDISKPGIAINIDGTRYELRNGCEVEVPIRDADGNTVGYGTVRLDYDRENPAKFTITCTGINENSIDFDLKGFTDSAAYESDDPVSDEKTGEITVDLFKLPGDNDVTDPGTEDPQNPENPDNPQNPENPDCECCEYHLVLTGANGNRDIRIRVVYCDDNWNMTDNAYDIAVTGTEAVFKLPLHRNFIIFYDVYANGKWFTGDVTSFRADTDKAYYNSIYGNPTGWM